MTATLRASRRQSREAIRNANRRLDAALFGVSMRYPDRADDIELTEQWTTVEEGVYARLATELDEGGYTLVLSQFAPGAWLSPHYHDFHEEIHVVRGSAQQFISNGKPGGYDETDMRVGSYALIPEGVGHATHAGPGGCVMLIKFHRTGDSLPRVPEPYEEAEYIKRLRSTFGG
ncbi:MAG: hypothetical protein Rubg2KO_15620 [Rubricoccaceae bacterium]